MADEQTTAQVKANEQRGPGFFECQGACIIADSQGTAEQIAKAMGKRGKTSRRRKPPLRGTQVAIQVEPVTYPPKFDTARNNLKASDLERAEKLGDINYEMRGF